MPVAVRSLCSMRIDSIPKNAELVDVGECRSREGGCVFWQIVRLWICVWNAAGPRLNERAESFRQNEFLRTSATSGHTDHIVAKEDPAVLAERVQDLTNCVSTTERDVSRLRQAMKDAEKERRGLVERVGSLGDSLDALAAEKEGCEKRVVSVVEGKLGRLEARLEERVKGGVVARSFA